MRLFELSVNRGGRVKGSTWTVSLSSNWELETLAVTTVDRRVRDGELVSNPLTLETRDAFNSLQEGPK